MINSNEIKTGISQNPPIAKHVRLQHSILSIDTVIDSLNDLLEKVNGNEKQQPPNVVDKAVNITCLQGVLSEGSSVIDDKVDRANGIINELNDILF